ncbi:MAG: response regulator [Thermodesulfovibrionales bacterium]|jgi:two-component system response regulator MprA
MNPDEISILMVDDDSMVRDMIAFILESNDYVVETAGDGLEALEKYKARPTHVIITDMNMPEMDGLALIKELRRTDSDVAIILLTGNDDTQTLGIGVDECIAKDENISDTIVATVDAVIKKKKGLMG